jgi:phage tail-like protein
MPLPDVDSSVGHSFGVEFDGVVIKNIIEVSGLKMQRQKAGEVTLTRGLTHDAGFETWMRDALSAPTDEGARRGGAIIVFDFEGTAIKRYRVVNAHPRSLEIGTLKAGDTSVLVEKLVLAYESLEFG